MGSRERIAQKPILFLYELSSEAISPHFSTCRHEVNGCRFTWSGVTEDQVSSLSEPTDSQEALSPTRVNFRLA